jgi:hypothetical protein
MTRLKELREEFSLVLSGRGLKLLDSILPLVVFLIANPLLGLNPALWGALGVAAIFAIYRIIQKESLVYSLGGLSGVLLAAIFVNLSGTESGFFLPSLISGGITVVLCIITVTINRPIVAWTSFIARRWPLAWYWHPQVLPAYNEVTIAWAVVFSARLILEYLLFQEDAVNALGVTRIVLGWPFTIALLVASYLYGLWRLGRLAGPSVEEFKAGKSPPWEGQKRGF